MTPATVWAAGPTEVAGAAVAPVATPTASAVTGGCAATVGCGAGCQAELLHGVCLLAVRWEGALHLGPFQIGPMISGSCDICECWYRYTNANGDSILMRTTSLGCGATAPGVEIHVT